MTVPEQAVVAAQHRAMPYTRLVDYGMDHADARLLLDRTEAGEWWHDVAREIGERQRARGERARGEGRLVTAAEAYRCAAAAFAFEQMAHENDDDDKRAGYLRHVDAVAALADLPDECIERIEIPYRGGVLSGWLALPAHDPGGTVVVWGGLSGWGAAYLAAADAYRRRGLACLLAEGPGQGVPRLEHGLHIDTDVIDGFAAFVAHVEADPRLVGPIAVQGNSFGGLFAAHLAHRDARVAACIVNGAPPEPTVPEFRTARVQLAAAIGDDDLERIAAVVRALRFDPVEHRIACPLLVLAGDRDLLAPSAVQQPFADAGDPDRTELCIWPDGEHTLYNHAAERDAVVGDWIRSVLPPADRSTSPAGGPGNPRKAP